MQGTKAVLEAAHKYGKNVKKIVYTSSVAAAYPVDLGPQRPEITIDENSWNPVTIEEAESGWVFGYSASKKLAEQALWEFKKTEKPSFEVATIVVPLVYGPPICQTTYSTLPSSPAFFKAILGLPVDTKKIPSSGSAHADVRDIARTHIKALFDDRFNNGRWIACEGFSDNQVILDIIHKYRPEDSAHIAVGAPNSFQREKFFKYDDSKTRAIVEFEFIPFEKSVIDEFDALLALKKKEEAA